MFYDFAEVADWRASHHLSLSGKYRKSADATHPFQQLLDGQAGLFGPVPDKIHDRVADIRFHPASVQSSPSSFYASSGEFVGELTGSGARSVAEMV